MKIITGCVRTQLKIAPWVLLYHGVLDSHLKFMVILPIVQQEKHRKEHMPISCHCRDYEVTWREV